MVTVFPSPNLTEASPGGLSGFLSFSCSCATQATVHTTTTSMTNIPRRLLRIALSCCLQIVTFCCRSIIHTGAERYNSIHGHSGRKARRVGAIRVHDGCAARTVGGGARCFDGRADHGGPAWRLLPERPPAGYAGHGHPDRDEGYYRREGADFVGDGGDQKSERRNLKESEDRNRTGRDHL